MALPALWPSIAQAHGFGESPTISQALHEGVAVMLGWPAVTVTLIACGLLVGMAFSMVRHLWLGFLIGQILGLGLTVAPQTWHFFATFAAGLVASGVAATGVYRRAAVSWLAVGGVGMATQLAALDGHPLGDLPAMIHLGYMAVAGLVVAIVAGALALVLGLSAHPAMRIGARILVSWCLAMLVLMLAVVLRAAG